MLGYNAAKTKMLVGQWRLDLVALERKLQHELDEGPENSFSRAARGRDVKLKEDPPFKDARNSPR